jgi:hypothetical protein
MASGASGFEFCDIEGSVLNVNKQSNSEYVLLVDVTGASRAKVQGDLSYIDCSEHVGTQIEASFRVPKVATVPAVGDVVSFSRSAVDGFSQGGEFVGTTITTGSLKVLKPAGASHGL